MQIPKSVTKLISTGEAAFKSFLGLGENISVTAISPGAYRGASDVAFGNSGWVFETGNGMEEIHFRFGGLQDVVQAYEQCAPVYSIINKQAYAFTNGKTVILNTDGNSKGKEATGPWATKVRNLISKPNPLQNWKQFEAQAAIYLRLFGYCVVLPAKPVGFSNEDASALWIIPPYLCTFKFSGSSYFKLEKGWVKGVKVNYGEEETTYNVEDLIILRDITPGFDDVFLPGSPIKPIQKNISNLIGLYESKGTLINYRGALGVLSPEQDPNGAITMTPAEKMNLETGLLHYGLRRGQSKFIVSNAAMNWQQMGMPYRDLMLTEWAEDDTMVVCDALNYPFKLLANTKSSSINGTEVEAFKKILYQDFVIPFAGMVYEQLSDAFKAEANGCVIGKDYCHIAVLQEDALKAAQSRLQRNNACLVEFYNNAMKLNRWRELNGEPPIEPVENVGGGKLDIGNMYYYQLKKLGIEFGGSGGGAAPKDPNAPAGENAGEAETGNPDQKGKKK